MKKYPSIIKAFVLVFFSGIALFRTNLNPLLPGDGLEYLLMSEAMYNHFSADIRLEDGVKLKDKLSKNPNWETRDYKERLDGFIKIYGDEGKFVFMDQKIPQVLTAKNGKNYSLHFYFYSLVNQPSRYVTALFSINPLYSFHLTNALFILLCCALFMFYTKEYNLWSILLATVFFFGNCFWYIDWIHPEVITVCLLASGLFLLFQRNFIAANFLIALSTLQSQPLAILFGFTFLYTISELGIKNKKNVYLLAMSVIPILPQIFYYLHFNTPNLVKHLGFMDSNNISFDRLLSYFFDINQGCIIAIPLLFAFYVYLLAAKIIKTIKKQLKLDFLLFIPITLIFIVLVVSSMSNWNHGQSIISRYAIWGCTAITIHFFFLLKELPINPKYFTMLSIVSVSQVALGIGFQCTNIDNYGADRHKSLPKYIIENYPSLYNPDPAVFISRTSIFYGAEMYSHLPVYYWKNNTEIVKMIVPILYLDSLVSMGIDKAELDNFKKQMDVKNGWFYINNTDLDLKNISRLQKTKLLNHKIQSILNKMNSSETWIRELEKKALEWKMPLDTVKRKDALYLIEQEEKDKNK